MLKLLILGGAGQLGSDSSHVLKDTYEVKSVTEHELDVTRKSDLDNIFRSFNPDIILNCAAYTNVDACESDRERADSVNAAGPGNIARCVQDYGGKLVHISTDYVFDGLKELPHPYTEVDKTSPLSCYGITKLDGEIAVKKAGIEHIIVRVAWLYGFNGKNFPKTILRLVLENPEKPLKIINDQYGSPTWSLDVARQIAKLLEAGGSGTYHATSGGYCTWYEFADYFLSTMGVEYSVIPCTTEEFPTPAQRPRNSILDNKRLKSNGINIMPDWKEGVDRFVAQYKTKLIEEAKIN